MFGYQRFSGKYVIDIQDENTFNNIQKLYIDEKLMGQWLLITTRNWLDNESWLPLEIDGNNDCWLSLEIDGTMTLNYH
jgi:hypothetical protein